MLRPAKPSDLSAITALLAEFGLPTKGVVDLLENFIVVELKGELIGVGGSKFVVVMRFSDHLLCLLNIISAALLL